MSSNEQTLRRRMGMTFRHRNTFVSNENRKSHALNNDVQSIMRENVHRFAPSFGMQIFAFFDNFLGRCQERHNHCRLMHCETRLRFMDFDLKATNNVRIGDSMASILPSSICCGKCVFSPILRLPHSHSSLQSCEFSQPCVVPFSFLPEQFYV